MLKWLKNKLSLFSRQRNEDAERQAAELARVPKVVCDTSNLACNLWSPTPEQLFKLPELDAEWPQRAQEIEPVAPPDGTGGVNFGDRRAIYYLLRQLAISSLLEIGTHVGASTVWAAAALRENRTRLGRGSACLDTVDIRDVNDPVTTPWREFRASRSPAELIAAVQGLEFVHFHARSSLEYLRSCKARYDLVFLDGDHAATTVYQELPAALRVLKPGGYVLLHDYFPHGAPLWPQSTAVSGPWLAVQRLKEEGADLNIVPLGALPWPTKLGTNITSLALVLRQDPATGQGGSA